MQHAVLGTAMDQCIVGSFLALLPPYEKDCLSRALDCVGPFPREEIIDLLDDYNLCQLPTADNIRSIHIFVGTAEFVTKPFMCLTSLRQGMGDLWSNVSKEAIASLYEMSRPTAARIMANLALTPENAKEAQIFWWLDSISKDLPTKCLPNFSAPVQLRMCYFLITALQCIQKSWLPWRFAPKRTPASAD